MSCNLNLHPTLPPQGRAPSGVSQVDPLPGTTPVEVAVGSDSTRGAASGGAASGGAELGVAEAEAAGSRVAEPRGEDSRGAEPAGVEPGGAEPLLLLLISDQGSLPRLVYGLRQAPREWHDTLRTALAALGFAPSTADPSLFLCTDTSLPSLYVLLYVVDLVFATVDTKALTLVKSELQKRHTCTDLGELHSYLGLQITQDRAQHTITLTQSHMVHHVLQRVGF
ncbi:unnamed protein product [Closterium sp. NIES-54]